MYLLFRSKSFASGDFIICNIHPVHDAMFIMYFRKRQRFSLLQCFEYFGL